MASYINVFLKTEITVIPRLLDKYIGKYYNNTLCNAATWMFLSWYLLHVIFDDLLNALLRRMKFKEYVRIRLKRSLWYLGFYSTACVYSIATLLRNNVQFYTKNPFDSTSTPSGHLILGFIVLATFYLHSAFWERLKYCHVILASSFLCLFFLLCFSYFLRFVESTIKLTILICFTQIALEVARCVAILIKKTEYSSIFPTGVFFTIGIFSFIINYLLISPLLLGYPLLKIFSPSASILLLFLLTWLMLEIYDSVAFKAATHWVNHTNGSHCDTDIIECSLFPPRNDATYNFLILRKELKERKEKCLSLRRPKNRNVVMQTLKCMVAIKRKLNAKRQTAINMVAKENKELQNDYNEESESNSLTDDSRTDGTLDVNTEEIVGGVLQFSIAQNNTNDSNDHVNQTHKYKED